MAVYTRDCATMNNNLCETIMPDLNYYGNEVILPDMEYYNNQVPYRPPPRQAQQKKKKRTKFSRVQLDRLEASFSEEKYPSKRVIAELAGELDLEAKTVRVWFQNRRSKFRKFHKVPTNIMLDHSARETHQYITNHYDGYCPTCLLPVQYRSYEDGRWIYCRPQNDSKSDESKKEESQILNRDDSKSARAVDDDFKNERGYESEDFDSILQDVELLCK